MHQTADQSVKPVHQSASGCTILIKSMLTVDICIPNEEISKQNYAISDEV